MSAYSSPPTANPYWYYDPHGYQPNVSVSFNTNISVNTSASNSSFDVYNNSRFADSGFLSRTPTPPTPVHVSSPQPMSIREDLDNKENDSRILDRSSSESKPRLPYVKRTRIQYTLEQLQILEEAFQKNHYPEVTTVDMLAEYLDVRHEKISIWFQNRRSRFKRQQKPKSTTSTNDPPRNIVRSHAMSSVMSSPSYEPSSSHEPSTSHYPSTSYCPPTSYGSSASYCPPTSYYPPYFWPSPIVDRHASVFDSHNPVFYE